MKVYIEKVATYDYDKIKALLKTLPLWNKLEGKHKILVKPNLLGAFAPEKAATTHPVVVDAVVSILQEMGKEVLLGDSPGGTAPVKKVWQETGMAEVAQKHNINMLKFGENGVLHKKGNGIDFHLTKDFWDVDAVINVCKYKTHSLMSYTGAIKNLYGLIPGVKKSDYHKEHPDHIRFSKVIVELYKLVSDKLAFSIMDGIIGMEGEGPSAGDPRNFGVLLASEKASALDHTAASMMGFKPNNLEYIMPCLEHDEVAAEDVQVDDEWIDFCFPNVKIKRVGMIVKILAYSPEFLKNAFRRLFTVYPDFKEGCKKCRICVDSCPVQAMKLGAGDDHPVIDHIKCIKCMCCHEMCPYSVVYVKKSFLAKLVIR
jgi:uncharacterized protein (DUF362 family)/NAD-dependent dihydropyrimidine dehydrogenase PreA subunit